MKAFRVPVKKNADRRCVGQRRAVNRIPTRNYAYLQNATGGVLSECLVKDISETGARIILPKMVSLPKRIILRITGEAIPMNASVVWQAGTKCGLEFNDVGCV